MVPTLGLSLATNKTEEKEEASKQMDAVTPISGFAVIPTQSLSQSSNNS